MPTNRFDPPDFPDRRRRIGASREVMAIGLGLTATEIQEIERTACRSRPRSHRIVNQVFVRYREPA